MSKVSTAQGTLPIIRTPHMVGSLHTTRNPQSEARRQQVHGKLLPMERPLKDEGKGFDHLDIWDEQPQHALGAILLAALLGLIVAAVLWVAAVHQTPAATSQDVPPDAVLSPAPVVEVGASKGERGR